MKLLLYLAIIICLLVAILSWPFVAGLGQQAGRNSISGGDSNGDGRVDISDALHTLNFLFSGGPAPALCQSFHPDATEVLFDPSGTALSGTRVDTILREVDLKLESLYSEDSALSTRVSALEGTSEIELISIPAGTFLMGSPETERKRQATETLHVVTISKNFYIAAT